MSSPASDFPPRDNQPEAERGSESTVIAPLIVWMLIQVAALGVAASGVRLSARFADPPQSLALDGMLIAQFVGSALFHRVLFRGWRAWLGMVITAWVMLVLASTMTAVPLSRVTWLWVQVGAWLSGLRLWRTVAPSHADVIAAIAMLGSAGGLVLAYLQAEFGGVVGAGVVNALPLAGAIRHLAATRPFLPPFLSTISLSVAALLILASYTVKTRGHGLRRGIKMTAKAR